MYVTQKYDYLIVGAGLWGSLFAYLATRSGRKCLVVDRRNHTGGNLHCEDIDGITVHKYGAHIFHTSQQVVWDFVNSLTPFMPFTHRLMANYCGQIYNLPINLSTFRQLWGVDSVDDITRRIDLTRVLNPDPQNLEEYALNLLGREIYEKLIKGYSEKQWGCVATNLPADILKRMPVRYTDNNNYFDDTFSGIPSGGYNILIDKLLMGVDVRLECDFTKHREALKPLADKIVYTGGIDSYYNYRFGALDYRSLRFETSRVEEASFQGCAVMNYTAGDIEYTRIIEHKYFEAELSAEIDRGGIAVPTSAQRSSTPHTIITYEYPEKWNQQKEAYYPIRDQKNNQLYLKYRELAEVEKDVVFGGRLGHYQYYDMDKIVEQLLRYEQEVGF